MDIFLKLFFEAKRGLFLVLACIQLFLTNAQTPDVLKRALVTEKSAEKRVDLWNDLADYYWEADFFLARAYTDSALQLSKEINYQFGILQSTINKGISEFSIDNYSLTLKYYHEALELAISLNNKAYINRVNTLKANAYLNQGDYKKCLDILDEISGTLKPNTRAEASYLATLSRVFLSQGYSYKAEPNLQRALKIRLDSGYQNYLSSVYLLLAKVKTDQSKFAEADKYFKDAVRYAKEQGQMLRLGNAYIEYGEKYMITRNYDSAEWMFTHALQLYEKGGSRFGVLTAKVKLGELHLNRINYVQAQEYLLEALELADEVEALKWKAEAYNHLSWLYKNEKNYRKSFEYIDKALEIERYIGDKKSESTTLNYLGTIYLSQNDLENALKYFEQSLALRKEIEYTRGVADVLFNIGTIKEEQGFLDDAFRFYKSSYDFEIEMGRIADLAYNYNAFASISLKKGELKDARINLEKALDNGLQYQNAATLSTTYKLFADLFEKSGDFRNAYLYHKKFKNFSDSLFSIEKSRQLLEMQAGFELEDKDRQIVLLNAQNEASRSEMALQKLTIERQQIMIIAIVIGLVLVAVTAYVFFMYFRSRSKANELLLKLNREITDQKEEIEAQSEELKEASENLYMLNQNLEVLVKERTEKLQEAYKELDTFFYRSSHDFRRPITTFLGLAEVARVTIKDEQAINLFEKVKETATNLDKMLSKLQSISYVGSQELVYKEVYFEGIIESIISNLIDEIRARRIIVNTHVKLDKPFISYPLYISIILENLIENSINFSLKDGSRIDIDVSNSAEERLVIRVKDNGIGIPQQYQHQIFDMYYRASEHSKGNGLGLYITKKAVEKLEGTIKVESSLGEGTEFIIDLPGSLQT